MQPGPEPTTDREYLIQIYALLRGCCLDIISLKRSDEEQADRIAALEKKWWAVLGIAGTAGGIVGFAASLLMRLTER